MTAIDINADLGESYSVWRLGADADLLPLLTSANVACGWHGGDPRVMDDTVAMAMASGAAVGAHPSFPDRDGFGRRTLDVTGREAETDVIYQVAALDGFCRRRGAAMQHVKAHGALYTHAARDLDVARGIAAGVAGVRSDLIMVVPGGSELERAAREAGLPVALEGFIDRGYNPDGSLVSRRLPGAVHAEVEVAAEQAVRMVRDRKVRCADGTVIDIEVDTLCCHGDNPRAAEFVRRVRQVLDEAGVEIKPMREVVGAARG